MQTQNIVTRIVTGSVPINTLPVVIAADTSGSMQTNVSNSSWFVGGKYSTRGDVLNAFLADLRKNLKVYHTLYWSDGVRERPANETVIPCGGGTYPSLLARAECDRFFTNGQVLVFTTDGEIDSAELARFSETFRHKFQLVICAITVEAGRDKSRLNMSVLSPFLSSNHVALYVNEHSIEVLTTTVPTWHPAGSIVNAADVASIVIGKVNPCPAGYTPLGNSYVRLDNISNFTYDEMKAIDFGPLVLKYKTLGKLSTLRGLVKRFSPQIVKADAASVTIDAIANCRDPEQLAKLQAKLHEIRYSPTKQRDDEIRIVSAQVNSWLGQIHEAEKAGYDVADIQKITSNRLLRAETVSDPGTAIDPATAAKIEFECPICTEGGVGALMIKSPKVANPAGMYDPAGDYMVSSPLAYNGVLLCNEVYCLECATTLLSRGKDGYQTPVVGIIPLVDFGRNWPRVSYDVYHALTYDRKGHHAFKLIYASIVYSMMSEWTGKLGMRAALEYVMNQILDNTRDRLGMSEGGDVVPLRHVIETITKADHIEGILRQPFQAVLVTLYTLHRLGASREAIQILAQKAFCRAVLGAYNSYLNNNNNRYYKSDIRHDLFNMPYGVPVLDTAHTTSFAKSRTIRSMFGWNSGDNHTAYQHIEYLIRNCGVTLTDSVVTAVLVGVSTRKQHLHLETALSEVLSSCEVFRLAYNCADIKQELLVEAVRDIVGRFHETDSAHIPPPGFPTPVGPSKLACVCGFRFDVTDEGAPISPYDIESMTSRRVRHFQDVYGGFHPGPSTGHFNLHEAIKHVLWKYPEAKTLTRRHVIEIIVELAGRKDQGNIYIAGLAAEVVAVAKTFLRARARFPHVHQQRYSRLEAIELERNCVQSDYDVDYSDDPLMAPLTADEMKEFGMH